ncbi:MAG: ABC-F family ATP-binding cassette domain-containing protein [Polyangiaceae bacterium]|nr:ABC-F family ATP-binding cassette domain-containing protein [Polyangiaceae bacterium]
MPVVAAHELAKAYGTREVLRSASLTVRSGERVGVVGSNGSGKSTFARLLAGLDTPDRGTVTRRRGASVLYLEQVPRFDPADTAAGVVSSGLVECSRAVARHREASAALAAHSGDAELLLEAQARAAEDVERLGGWDQGHKVAAMLGELGIDRPDATIETLSGGEQRRVALARILLARPELAILDEPTNHLDAETVQWLEQYLMDEFAGAVLLITHDRYLLDRVAHRTVEIADGELYVYDGGYELYLEQKAQRLALAERTEQNRQNYLRRELEWLRRQPKARTGKQKARIDRAEAVLAMKAPKVEQTPSFGVDVATSGQVLLELRGLCGGVEGLRLFEGVDLFVRKGERIGIVGRNGTGKTTLLRTVVGELEPWAGGVYLGRRTRIGYFDQQRSGLDDQKSVFDNAIGDLGRIDLAGEPVEPRAYLGRFGFDGHKQRQPLGSMSGGERARVLLARLLSQSTNLIVMDEPTNDLDVATLGALESLLVDFGVAALVVTHDRWFLDRVATSILAFEGEGRVVQYPGNYETCRRLRAEAARHEKRAEPATKPRARSPGATPSQKRKSLGYDAERELQGLPDAIDQAEACVTELNERLADPRTYTDGTTDVAQLAADLEAAKLEVSELLERWEQLELEKQALTEAEDG